MLNKPYRVCGFFLCLNLGIGIFPVHAKTLNCTIVAKIYKTEGIETVRILRASGEEEFASRKNRKLCVNDKVIVPKDISLITLRYYRPRYMVELKGGDEYVVCGRNFLGFKCLLAYTPVMEQGFRASNPNEPIFMPLAAGKKADSPFYLFSREGDIPLVWYGGQSPYQLEVKDATGQVIVEKLVNVPDTAKERENFLLTVPHTTPGSTYSLTIQSNDSKPLHKTLKFIEPPQFASEDQWMKLVFLLADCYKTGKNWRLEIWRQLSTMPNSDQKKNFMDHLEKNDLKPSHFELCQ